MRDAQGMAHRTPLEILGDLRARLEVARLDLLALFRALDRMDLSPQEIPQRLLRQLMERDADYAEALWALDQMEGSWDRRARLRDTLTALDRLPSACAQFRKQLPDRAQPTLEQTGRPRPQGTQPQRGLQHGTGPRSRKRVSTPTRPRGHADNLTKRYWGIVSYLSRRPVQLA